MESLFRLKESLMESSFGRMEARINTLEHLLRVWCGRYFWENQRNFGWVRTVSRIRRLQRNFVQQGVCMPPPATWISLSAIGSQSGRAV